MADKILYFPRGIEIRITPKSVVTDEFRRQIRDSFRDYTYGTREDYRLCNQGEFSMDDFKDFEILGGLINEGVGRSLQDWHHWSGDHHLDEPACKFVQAAIEEVMNYPETDARKGE